MHPPTRPARPPREGAPPLWLKSPSLPRTFVLELLDFVLAHSPAVFLRLPPFQNALSVRMTQLIQAQLQDHLDAGAAGASFAPANFSTFRALLRLACTLLRSYYPLLGPRSGTLVQSLLAGAWAGWGGAGLGAGAGRAWGQGRGGQGRARGEATAPMAAPHLPPRPVPLQACRRGTRCTSASR